MTRAQFWLTTAIGGACLLLVVLNILLVRDNVSTRNDIAARQQYVQQSLQLEGLYRDIVRSLAELAARNKDGDVTALLSRHGITYNLAPGAAASSGAATAAPGAAAGSPGTSGAPSAAAAGSAKR